MYIPQVRGRVNHIRDLIKASHSRSARISQGPHFGNKRALRQYKVVSKSPLPFTYIDIARGKTDETVYLLPFFRRVPRAHRAQLQGPRLRAAGGASPTSRRRSVCPRDEHKLAGYLALHPQGLVPALEDGGRIFVQSLALMNIWRRLIHSRRCCLRAPRTAAYVRAVAQIIACEIHPAQTTCARCVT